MLCRLLLFSSGQDSSSLLFFLLLQQKQKNIILLTTNHETQINSFRNVTHTFIISSVFQEKYIILFLKVIAKELNEDNLRFFRYSGVVRIQNFYGILYFLSGHNESDLLETYFLNWRRTFLFFQKSLSFKSKILTQKTYYQGLTSNVCQKKIQNVTLKNKKKSKAFSYSFSSNKRSTVFLTRPLKSYSRQGLQSITYRIPLYIFTDLTNFDFGVTRNKIRRHFLLYIERFL